MATKEKVQDVTGWILEGHFDDLPRAKVLYVEDLSRVGYLAYPYGDSEPNYSIACMLLASGAQWVGPFFFWQSRSMLSPDSAFEFSKMLEVLLTKAVDLQVRATIGDVPDLRR